MEALSVHDQRYLHEFPLGLFVEPEFCELIVVSFVQSDERTVFIEEHYFFLPYVLFSKTLFSSLADASTIEV
jgi:hypothetical protein